MICINTNKDLSNYDANGNLRIRITHKLKSYDSQTIKTWCEFNNKPYELLSERYEKSNIKLRWKCV